LTPHVPVLGDGLPGVIESFPGHRDPDSDPDPASGPDPDGDQASSV